MLQVIWNDMCELQILFDCHCFCIFACEELWR